MVRPGAAFSLGGPRHQEITSLASTRLLSLTTGREILQTRLMLVLESSSHFVLGTTLPTNKTDISSAPFLSHLIMLHNHLPVHHPAGDVMDVSGVDSPLCQGLGIQSR